MRPSGGDGETVEEIHEANYALAQPHVRRRPRPPQRRLVRDAALAVLGAPGEPAYTGAKVIIGAGFVASGVTTIASVLQSAVPGARGRARRHRQGELLDHARHLRHGHAAAEEEGRRPPAQQHTRSRSCRRSHTCGRRTCAASAGRRRDRAKWHGIFRRAIASRRCRATAATVRPVHHSPLLPGGEGGAREGRPCGACGAAAVELAVQSVLGVGARRAPSARRRSKGGEGEARRGCAWLRSRFGAQLAPQAELESPEDVRAARDADAREGASCASTCSKALHNSFPAECGVGERRARTATPPPLALLARAASVAAGNAMRPAPHPAARPALRGTRDSPPRRRRARLLSVCPRGDAAAHLRRTEEGGRAHPALPRRHVRPTARLRGQSRARAVGALRRAQPDRREIAPRARRVLRAVRGGARASAQRAPPLLHRAVAPEALKAEDGRPVRRPFSASVRRAGSARGEPRLRKSPVYVEILAVDAARAAASPCGGGSLAQFTLRERRVAPSH